MYNVYGYNMDMIEVNQMRKNEQESGLIFLGHEHQRDYFHCKHCDATIIVPSYIEPKCNCQNSIAGFQRRADVKEIERLAFEQVKKVV